MPGGSYLGQAPLGGLGVLGAPFNPPSPLLDLLLHADVDPHERLVGPDPHSRTAALDPHVRVAQVWVKSNRLQVDPHGRRSAVDPHERGVLVDG